MAVYVQTMDSSKDTTDIPGASLNGRDSASLKIPELKRWLDCRQASTRGKKADLVLRWNMNEYNEFIVPLLQGEILY